jgi:hypothetical protein
MAIKRFDVNDAVEQDTDAEYECRFTEAAPGQPDLDAAAILTIEATLQNVSGGALIPGEIIHGRDGQDVKNLNGGTLASDGLFTLQLSALDNVIVEADWPRHVEEHRLTLVVTYTKTGGGTGQIMHVARFFVNNLAVA